MGDEVRWLDRTAMAMLRPFRPLRRQLLAILSVLLGLMAAPLLVPALLRALDLGIPNVVTALLGVVLLAPLIFWGLVIDRGLRMSAAYTKAHANDDFAEVARLKRLMDGDGPPRSELERAQRALGEAELLLSRERWAEARDTFARVDRAALPELSRPGVLGQQGYATAHAGQPELGVELLEKAREEADALPTYPADKRWHMCVRLGVALSIAGRHDDAVAVLEDVLAVPDTDARPWTASLFFLARSLRANGRGDDAMACLVEATQFGDGPFAARARAALELASGSPLRDGGALPEPREDEACEEEHSRLSRGR